MADRREGREGIHLSHIRARCQHRQAATAAGWRAGTQLFYILCLGRQAVHGYSYIHRRSAEEGSQSGFHTYMGFQPYILFNGDIYSRRSCTACCIHAT